MVGEKKKKPERCAAKHDVESGPITPQANAAKLPLFNRTWMSLFLTPFR